MLNASKYLMRFVYFNNVLNVSSSMYLVNNFKYCHILLPSLITILAESQVNKNFQLESLGKNLLTESTIFKYA